MQRLYFILCSILLAGFAQTTFAQCPEGRYVNKTFSVKTNSAIQYGQNYNDKGVLQNLNLDLYEPKDDDALQRPVIMLMYGGSFTAGVRISPDIVDLCQRFAKKGYVCISIDYRLASQDATNINEAVRTVSNAVHDGKAAIRFLRKTAREEGNPYKIDTNQIFAGGVSAGAFIALHMAYLDREDEIALFSDTTGFAALGGLEGNSGNPGFSSKINGVINLCGALGTKYWMTKDDPFLISCHGTNDGTVPYKTDYVTALGDIGLKVDGSYVLDSFAHVIGLESHLYTYQGMDHVPFVYTNIGDILAHGNVINTDVMNPTEDFITQFMTPHIDCTNLYGSPNAISETETQFVLYPNPTNGRFSLLTQGITPKTVLVFDASGRKLQIVPQFEADRVTIDITAYPAGVYWVKTQTEQSVQTQKVVKL